MKELKKYLMINSAFSAIAALTMLLIPSGLNNLFNIVNSYVFPIIGLNLLTFSIFVWYVSGNRLTNKTLVTTIIILDLLWVLGSFLMVAFRIFNLSELGNTLIAVVAVWILFLAFKQYQNNR